MAVELLDFQIEALGKMKNGSVLCADTGLGKSITGLAYYFTKNGGKVVGGFKPMPKDCQDLYIITTAKKRDELEWEKELTRFLLYCDENGKRYYNNTVKIDSWNNIGKYDGVKGAFFIFDEQRVKGGGKWSKTFVKITKSNEWILLTATPGDKWENYFPIFQAHGFYKNKTDFNRQHVVFNPYITKYPQVMGYKDEAKLRALERKVLVIMKGKRKTTKHHHKVEVDYDRSKYREITKTRWNPYKDKPIENASELCYLWRKVVNSDPGRVEMVKKLAVISKKSIIFYNFDYELELMKEALSDTDLTVAEWNGHKHQSVPKTSKWVYLVQYNAGSEGWNCVTTNVLIFYSQSYSYTMMIQAEGRIDRMNTPYSDLHYYVIKSKAPIDLAISRALDNKEEFNEGKFLKSK